MPSPPLQWPLIGRGADVDLFATTLEDPRAHGFVIHGPAGVGKTRLADECLGVAAGLGRRVARATANEGTEHIPLGALAHLLPSGVADRRYDLVALFDEVGAVLRTERTEGDGRPLVLFVDDLHHLDPTSATLVGQLVDADLVFLVGTVRAHQAVPSALAALWHRARVRRVDLVDLSAADVDALLHVVLGAPVEPSAAAEIWAASEGNVLFVRELVLGSLESGRLTTRRGTWRLSGPMVTTARLLELVETRVSELGPDETEALDTLAIWEPASLSVLEAIVGRPVLESLDHAGLIAVRTDGRRQLVSLTHPLYGEIIRARIPALRRRRLLLDHVERIEQHGSRRREDPLCIAPARLDASGAADPGLLLQAARLARYGRDFPQVERMARAAALSSRGDSGGGGGEAGVEAGLLLGEALHELGAFAEAERVLAEASAAATTVDELFVPVISLRCLNLMWGLQRDDEALAVNRAARGRVVRPGDEQALLLNEATLLSYSGRPRQALDLLDQIDDVDDPWARAQRAIAQLPALIATGRAETAAARARPAFSEHVELAEPMAIADASMHTIHEVYALAESGRLRDAMAVGEAAYDAVPAAAGPDVAMWLAFQIGRSALLMGRPATARRWLSEAAARCDEHHFSGPRRLALSLLATAHAWLGDQAAATMAVAEIDALAAMAFARPDQELGRAWTLVASGDGPGGRAVLQSGVEMAVAGENLAAEALLLHDITRLGDAAACVARLEELADRCEGPLVAAYALHAQAAVGGRPEALVEVADRFDEMGAALVAAEASTEAALAWQRRGDQRAASAQFARASRLAAPCEGARTPALETPASFVPLTPRERDIATFAAQGQSSKAIAERLYLSVRTVNNHLQRVYAKLGVNGRRELAAALDDRPDLAERTSPAERADHRL